MPLVSVREVRSFQEAMALRPKRAFFNVPNIAGLVRREMSQPDAMIPIHSMGLLWNVAAGRFDIRYALDVAQAHFDVKRSYGTWGEMMLQASNVKERLVHGIDLMAAHAEDPRWALKDENRIFRLVRRWHYPNTTDRAEAFAAVSELREWLIVMQKDVREQIQPQELRLPSKLLQALRSDEREFFGGFFGCRVTEGNSPSMRFISSVLSFDSLKNDPEKFLFLQKQLRGDLKKERPTVGLVLPSTMKLNDMFIDDLDLRHRAVLNQAALDAADYIASLGNKHKKLCGVDIGARDLRLTEIFLRRLKAKDPSLSVEMIAVDPVLQYPAPDVFQRMTSLRDDLGIPVTLEGKEWNSFEQNLPTDKIFHFMVSFQTFSFFKPDDETRHIYLKIADRLVPGGRLFIAFEPYDKVTLLQYKGLTVHPRSVEWQRESAVQSGLKVDPSSPYPAHADSFRQTFVCFRFRK